MLQGRCCGMLKTSSGALNLQLETVQRGEDDGLCWSASGSLRISADRS